MTTVRRIYLPALAVGVLCMAVGTYLAGGPGLAAAAIGTAVVFVFFASTPLALKGPTAVAPGLAMVLALLFFATKVFALVAAMTVVLDPDGIGANVDTQVLGATLIASTLVWTFLQIRAATKTREPLYDLDEPA